MFVRKHGRVVDMLSLAQSLLGVFFCVFVPGYGVINFEGHINFSLSVL
jgi:hypothetical protein